MSDQLVVQEVTKSFPTRAGAATALAGIDLEIERGEFVSVIGPSGCGKSTLLRIVAGLLAPDTGSVSIFGQDPGRACADKQVGFVPQTPALLPWRSVLDNVRLPFQVNRKRRAVAADRDPVLDPAAVLDAVGLGGVRQHRPGALSGGMAQRVAIARAFVFGARLLVMDEPFSALDELTREALRQQLLELCQQHRKTVLFVTHSVVEAVLLSDRVVIMTPGPGRIAGSVVVDLPRPRQPGIELTEAFRAAELPVREHLHAA